MCVRQVPVICQKHGKACRTARLHILPGREASPGAGMCGCVCVLMTSKEGRCTVRLVSYEPHLPLPPPPPPTHTRPPPPTSDGPPCPLPAFLRRSAPFVCLKRRLRRRFNGSAALDEVDHAIREHQFVVHVELARNHLNLQRWRERAPDE